MSLNASSGGASYNTLGLVLFENTDSSGDTDTDVEAQYISVVGTAGTAGARLACLSVDF